MRGFGADTLAAHLLVGLIRRLGRDRRTHDADRVSNCLDAPTT
jgi:hypothetical protein